MPILDDIVDHEVIGPAILQGRREGRQEGRQEGLQEGRQEGRLEMLRHQLEKRFGPIPASIDSRLSTLSAAELDSIAVRLFDVAKLEELF
jgi:predicted transposase YdaD